SPPRPITDGGEGERERPPELDVQAPDRRGAPAGVGVASQENIASRLEERDVARVAQRLLAAFEGDRPERQLLLLGRRRGPAHDEVEGALHDQDQGVLRRLELPRLRERRQRRRAQERYGVG